MSAIQSEPTTSAAVTGSTPRRMPRVGDIVMYMFPMSMQLAGSGVGCPATVERVWTEDCVDLHLSRCIYRDFMHERYVSTKPQPERLDGRSWRWMSPGEFIEANGGDVPPFPEPPTGDEKLPADPPSPDVTMQASLVETPTEPIRSFVDPSTIGMPGDDAGQLEVKAQTSKSHRLGDLVIPKNARVTRWTPEGL